MVVGILSQPNPGEAGMGLAGPKCRTRRLVLLSLLLGLWQIHTRVLLCTQGRLRAAISCTWMEIKEEKHSTTFNKKILSLRNHLKIGFFYLLKLILVSGEAGMGLSGPKCRTRRLVLLSLLLGLWQIHTRVLLCTQGWLGAAISCTWMEIKEEKHSTTTRLLCQFLSRAHFCLQGGCALPGILAG